MKNKKHKIVILISIVLIVGCIFFIAKNNPVLADSGFDADWGSGSSDWGDSSSSSGGLGILGILGFFYPRFTVTGLRLLFDIIFANFNIVEATLLAIFVLLYDFTGGLSFLIVFIIISVIVNQIIKKIIQSVEYRISLSKAKKESKNNIFNNQQLFLSTAFETYKAIQIARMNFDYETLSKYTTQALFNEMKTQLKKLEERKQQNIVEDMQLKPNSTVETSSTANGLEVRIATLTITCKNYLIDQNTKQVLYGNKDKIVQYTYKLTFIQGDKYPDSKIQKPSLVLCKKEMISEKILNDEVHK